MGLLTSVKSLQSFILIRFLNKNLRKINRDMAIYWLLSIILYNNLKMKLLNTHVWVFVRLCWRHGVKAIFYYKKMIMVKYFFH